MRMRRALILPLTTVVLAACNDRRTPTTPTSAPTSPQFAISDGAHSNGNPNFFFLPPLVTNPNQNANWRNGSFNAHLMPVVRVFQQDPTATGCDASAPLAFGPAPMVLDTSSEQYQLNWDTKASSLTFGTNYRICVYGSPAAPDAGGTLLGYVDVQPVAGGMKKVATDEIYGFQDDRTLPIKVRIQRGALSTALSTGCIDPASCTEFTVAATGGDFTVPTKYAGLSIPPGAVPTTDTVTIVIAKQAPPYSEGTACLPTDIKQANGCWHFGSEPAGYQFALPVRMEVCVDVQYLPLDQQSQVELYKYNTDEGLKRLTPAGTTLIDCTSFTTAMAHPFDAPPTSLAAAALRHLERLANRLFAPRPLYAAWFAGVPKGIGGGGGSLSDYGGAVPGTATQASLLLTVPPSATVGETGLTATASGGSGTGAVSINSLTPTVCTVAGLNDMTVSITTSATGTCSLQATKAGDDVYMATTSTVQSFSVSMPPVLVDCPTLSYGSDLISRGFYVQSLPGTVVDSVRLAFYADLPSTQNVTLRMREGSYAGPTVAFDTLAITVPGGYATPTLATFVFEPLNIGYPLSGPGRLVTFTLDRMYPDASTWLYDVSTCFFNSDCVPPAGYSACNVVETEDTTPPLSTFRRNGVYVRIFGH